MIVVDFDEPFDETELRVSQLNVAELKNYDLKMKEGNVEIVSKLGHGDVGDMKVIVIELVAKYKDLSLAVAIKAAVP